MSRTVAVLMGGPDGEREVSLQSGAAVAEALEEAGYIVQRHVIDRPEIDDIMSIEADCIVPVLHGPFGEGGPLQELLEQSGTPFVGASSAAAAVAMDKMATKQRAASLGIRTPEACLIRSGQPLDLEPPLVLKPVDDGSSLDIAICRDAAEVRHARQVLHGARPRLMAERFIRGRELTVGILRSRALPIIEIIPAESHYDFAAKYQRDDTQYLVDPELPELVGQTCSRWALQLCEDLGCQDIARVDFMLDQEGPWLLEVNTMPGFTNHSLLPKAAREAGIPMPQLWDGLLRECGQHSSTGTDARSGG
ncbi:MAG: D-alanine--D-alanine ligase [Phycisphaerae bacterium]|nr:D-alanine--D-alanine ligase [Phycisphaerae bacterium]